MKRVITAALVAVVFVTNATPALAHDRDSLEIDPSCVGDGAIVGVRLLPEDVVWMNDYLTLGEVNYGIRNGFTRGIFECYSEREAAEQSRVSQVISSRSKIAVSADVLRWRPLVEAYFPEGWVEWALRIIDCETGHTGDPNILNRRGSSAAGLFQFLKGTWDSVAVDELGFPSYDSGAVLDPELNIEAAAYLLKKYGTGQWSCKASR